MRIIVMTEISRYPNWSLTTKHLNLLCNHLLRTRTGCKWCNRRVVPLDVLCIQWYKMRREKERKLDQEKLFSLFFLVDVNDSSPIRMTINAWGQMKVLGGERDSGRNWKDNMHIWWKKCSEQNLFSSKRLMMDIIFHQNVVVMSTPECQLRHSRQQNSRCPGICLGHDCISCHDTWENRIMISTDSCCRFWLPMSTLIIKEEGRRPPIISSIQPDSKAVLILSEHCLTADHLMIVIFTFSSASSWFSPSSPSPSPFSWIPVVVTLKTTFAILIITVRHNSSILLLLPSS